MPSTNLTWNHGPTTLPANKAQPPTRLMTVAIRHHEAHKRCMEVHAWLNPYRALSSNDTTQLDSKHILPPDAPIIQEIRR